MSPYRIRSANYWPTEPQILLLRAALCPEETALAAWQTLRPGLDLDSLDVGSQQLLPLLHRNLTRLGVDDPVLTRCKGVHRYHWTRNQMLFGHGASLLDALGAAGVPTLLLKGAALVRRYYDDPGLRPMSVLDIAVPAASGERAAAVLGQAGWSTSSRISRGFRRVKHAAPFADRAGFRCHLHWRIVEECSDAGADEDLWRASVQAEFQGRRTRTLSPADQLFHVCVHGARFAPEPGISWIADALAILEAGDVDWQRLVARSETRRLVLRVRETLEFLRTTMFAPVPDPVMADLARRPESRFERFERRVLSRSHPRLGQLPRYWCQHLRTQGGATLTAAATFPQYLQHTWGLAALRELPGSVVIRARRRLLGGS